MNAPPLTPAPGVEGSRCHAHPDQPALGVCTRCGVFFCDQDRRLVDGTPYCETCAVRPDVDYLEAFRLQSWGKRDPWAWLVGIGSLVYLLTGVSQWVVGPSEHLLAALFLLGAGVVGTCFWLGMPWARPAFISVPIVFLLLSLVKVGPYALSFAPVPLFIAIAIFRDSRNKLFFKQDVPREKLRRAWDLHRNNAVARAGFTLGVLGLANPLVGLIALTCSLIGLQRVNPQAQPPIGRKGQAIAGIVLGVVSVLLWGTFFMLKGKELVDYLSKG